MITCLIVEDNLLFSDALGAALRRRFPFLMLTKAPSVSEALAQIGVAPPELIFMDVNLPDGNGLALTKRLRDDGNTAVIAVLTSDDPSVYYDAALRSGADHFIGKGSMAITSIFDIVESIIASRFRALVVTADASFNDRMSAFLSAARPGAVVAGTADWNAALEFADTLKPSLVVLQSNGDPDRLRRFCDALRARRASGDMAVVRVGEIAAAEQGVEPANYCITREAALGADIVAIIDALAAAHDNDTKN